MRNEEGVYCEECLERDIESPMVLRDGQYGEFYGCGRYPKCKFTLNERQFNLLRQEQNED